MEGNHLPQIETDTLIITVDILSLDYTEIIIRHSVKASLVLSAEHSNANSKLFENKCAKKNHVSLFMALL